MSDTRLDIEYERSLQAEILRANQVWCSFCKFYERWVRVKKCGACGVEICLDCAAVDITPGVDRVLCPECGSIEIEEVNTLLVAERKLHLSAILIADC